MSERFMPKKPSTLTKMNDEIESLKKHIALLEEHLDQRVREVAGLYAQIDELKSKYASLEVILQSVSEVELQRVQGELDDEIAKRESERKGVQ